MTWEQELEDASARDTRRYIVKLEAEIDRLRALFRITAGQIERLAFDMPAPNDYTPQFVMLANDIRAALEPKP